MSASPNPISKIFRSLTEDGAILTGLRILHRFRLISVLHSFDFVYRKIEPVEISFRILLEGTPLEFREIKEGELDSLCFAEGMLPSKTMREHYGRGMRFFAAFREGIIIAVNGVHTEYAHLSYIKRRAVRLPEGTVYLNCALTSPVYRSLKVGTWLRTFLLNRLRQEGYQAIAAAVFTENKNALRWNLTNGFKQWGRIAYVQWLGRPFWLTQLGPTGHEHPHLLDHVLEEEIAPKLSLEAVS